MPALRPLVLAVTLLAGGLMSASATATAHPGLAPDVAIAHGPRLTYGSDGRGETRTWDCTRTVRPGQSVDAAIHAAGPHAVVCVRSGDYSGQIAHLAQPGSTLRAIGVVRLRSAVLSADRTTLDGFTLVGGTRYGHPQDGVLFGGQHQHIVNNVIDGHQLVYGIRCLQLKCNHALVYRNSVHNVQNYGLFIDNGTGSLIQQNNVYDLWTPYATSPFADDVDGVRFWGAQTFRFNYIHDINQFKSKPFEGDTPHTDCFQTYNNDAESAGTVIEGNYCVRIGRQCLIAQNDEANQYEIRDILFANNVCETYDSQSINLGSMTHVKVINNLILSGFRYQVVSFEQQGLDEDPPVPGPPNADNTVQNNILVKARKDATFYEYIGASKNEHIVDNLNVTDTSIAHLDPDFQRSRGAYPPERASDFSFYRSYSAARPVIDRGRPGNPTGRDIDAGPRVRGWAIDRGAYELG